ncbi:MAG: ATPase [Gemmatimonadetes bacterium]|nr:ATPase [Gemmatimonadota bacterium]
MPPAGVTDNPFRIGVAVRGVFFTDRADETARVADTLREGGARLLVVGERRVGKTSVLLRSIERVQRAGGHAFLVDCGTAGSAVEIANRVLSAATGALGRDWAATANDLSRRARGRIQLGTDLSGSPTVSFEPTFAADATAHADALATVLDALDARAKRERRIIGIALDEVQRLTAILGGEAGEWVLRGLLQHHQHLAYVLAGSEPTVLSAMQGHGRAFYQQMSLLAIGPIDPAHFARWIDDRSGRAGVVAPGLGAACLALAGPRTRDVTQLARAAFAAALSAGVTRPPRKKITGPELAAIGFVDLVHEQADPFRALWEGLARTRQQVLRALAVGDTGLTSEAARRMYGLGASGVVTGAIEALRNTRLVVRAADTPAGYAFDNPFFRGWVIENTLPDLGLALPATHLAARSAT